MLPFMLSSMLRVASIHVEDELVHEHHTSCQYTEKERYEQQ